MQKRKQYPFITVGIVVVILTIIAFAVAVCKFGWGWTGFTGYSPPTPQYQRGKTLWDWLQLLVIPLLLVIGGFWLNQVQKSRDEEVTEQRAKLERELARNNQEETLLQSYIDKISELLLKEHLGERIADGELKPEYEQVRNVARVRTITVLTHLNGRRVSYVFAFLREAELMSATKDNNAINLKNADLHEVNWSQSDLHEADLSGTNLREADLHEANLIKANLRGANLSGADLTGAIFFSNTYVLRSFSGPIPISNSADLSGADLSGANLTGAKVTDEQLAKAASLKDTTMPDGSTHR